MPLPAGSLSSCKRVAVETVDTTGVFVGHRRRFSGVAFEGVLLQSGKIENRIVGLISPSEHDRYLFAAGPLNQMALGASDRAATMSGQPSPSRSPVAAP